MFIENLPQYRNMSISFIVLFVISPGKDGKFPGKDLNTAIGVIFVPDQIRVNISIRVRDFNGTDL